nr:hypothetical protein [Xanthomonas sp. GW]
MGSKVRITVRAEEVVVSVAGADVAEGRRDGS